VEWLFCRSALKPISVISAHHSAPAPRSALVILFDSRSPLHSTHVTFRAAPLRSNSLRQRKRQHNLTTLLRNNCECVTVTQ